MISIGMIGIPILFFDVEGSPQQREVNTRIPLDFLESKYLYCMHHLLAAGPVFLFGILLNMYSYRKIFIKWYLPSGLIIACIFILWDMWFVHLGIWSFEKSYLLGVMYFNLPLEEYLWFLVIPFSGLFVFRIFEFHFPSFENLDSMLKGLTFCLVLILYCFGVDKLYSAISLAFSASMILFGVFWRIPGFGLFLLSFGANMLLMVFFNGMLTGLFTEKALVFYNPMEFSNIRILSFPLEDVGFGFSLLYGMVCLKYIIN